MELCPNCSSHAPAQLAFEQENRAYFAAAVPDRGDAFSPPGLPAPHSVHSHRANRAVWPPGDHVPAGADAAYF